MRNLFWRFVDWWMGDTAKAEYEIETLEEFSIWRGLAWSSVICALVIGICCF